jgi:hypothetical protein
VLDGLVGVNGYHMKYYQPFEELYLDSAAGTWLGPLVPGASTATLSNSQCTVNGSGTAVAGSGSTLT